MSYLDEILAAAGRAIVDAYEAHRIEGYVSQNEITSADRAAAKAALDAILHKLDDVPNDVLAAGYEAMFESKWDGTEAPMMGAGLSAMLAKVRRL